MAESRYRHEDVSAVPAGWKVRTVSHGDHRVRVAFPPGRRKTGSGRLVSILHPTGENPCGLRSTNPAELVIMGANPPRSHTRLPKAHVELYQMVSGLTGKPIRKATRVIFADGTRFDFIDRVPKRQAIKQAAEHLGRTAENPGDRINWMEEMVSRMTEEYNGYRKAGWNHDEALNRVLGHTVAGKGAIEEFKRRIGAGQNPAGMKHGLHIKFSPVNNAYFLMWHDQVLRIFETRREARQEMAYLLRNVKESGENPQNQASVYSKAVSMGYPYIRGDSKTSADGKTWLGRFTKTSEGTGPALYVGWNHDTRKWIIERGENAASANPRVEVIHGENPQLETIVEEFSGTPAEWVDVYDEPHMHRGKYAQLGPLIALYVKPATGGQVRRIGAPEVRKGWRDYWEDNPPMIVTDSSARQIYFVGGNQDITPALEAFGARDCGDGKFELGEVRRIDYECRKEHVATPDEDQWKHDHGEENGVLPMLMFDRNAKRLSYQGGDYRIEGAWIRN